MCALCAFFHKHTRRPRKIKRSITDRFGDIGTRQNYNRFFANPQRFTDLEIEATTNFIQSLINPKGEQPDDAE